MATRSLLVSLVSLPIVATAAAAEAAETRAFNSPSVRGVRLDWCKHWASACGKPAADLFCKEQGFTNSTRFSIDPNIGQRGVATLVFGDGRLCKAPTCSGFRTITCQRPQSAKTSGPAAPGAKLTLPGKALEKAPQKVPGREAAGPAKRPQIELVRPGKIVAPPEKKKPAFVTGVHLVPPLPAGASLFHCLRSDCEFALSHDLEIKPDATSQSVHFRWDVSKVAAASGVRWQVASQPFGAFTGGSQTDLDPAGLAVSGEGANPKGSFFPDFKDIAGKLAKGSAAPDSFYVRVLPLAKAGSGKVVGQPSNVVRVYYAGRPPPQEPVKFHVPETRREPGPRYTLVGVQYTPWKVIQKWPSGCKEIPRDDGKDAIEVIGDALEKTFDFASEGFDWIKDRVVDAASFVTGGIVPRQIFEIALNAALVSAGIPPDIPNFNEILSEGADQIAGEIAKQVVTQLPAGEIAGKLGEVAADLSKDEIARMVAEQGAEAVRERLEAELEKQTKDALRKAAAAAEAEIVRKAKDTYCRTKSIPPTYRVTVRNTGGKDYRDLKISVGDSEKVFKDAFVTINLGRGKTATAILMPDPEIRIVHRSQLQSYDDSRNQSHWFRAYYTEKRTRVRVGGTGDTVCEKRMAPPFDWQCHDEGRNLLTAATAVLMYEGHTWP